MEYAVEESWYNKGSHISRFQDDIWTGEKNSQLSTHDIVTMQSEG